MARTQDGELLNTLQEGFKYIENESFESTFSGLFSEINLGSDKLGKTYQTATPSSARSSQKIAEGLAEFSTDSDTLGDAYEYLIGQFAAGSGKKAGEFYTPPGYRHPVRHRHARQPGAEDRQAEKAGQRAGLCLRLGVAAAERAQPHGQCQAASARSTARRRTSPPTTSRG
jgi:hypothetical protein